MRDRVRGSHREDVLAMTMDERVKLALKLGDDDADLLAAGSGITRDEAIERMRELGERGRRPLHRLR